MPFGSTAVSYEYGKRAADMPGTLRAYYDLVAQLVEIKTAWEAAEYATPTAEQQLIHDAAAVLFDSTDWDTLIQRIIDAEATIASWDVDHAELLAL